MEGIKFSDLQLSENIMRAIDDLGFENATEIQSKAIPLIMEGHDVIGRSQTGSGKTIAFAIPALELISNFAKKNKPMVLVLCPTRELALQCADETRKLLKYNHGIKIVPLCGGMPMQAQLRDLKSGCSIVIGTPGRVMDHMRRGTLDLSELKMMVLDEADEMLSMGFKEDIETILQDVPEERQTVLFSATMPPAILNLTKSYQKDPQLIEVGNRIKAAASIKQTYYSVPMGRKNDALMLLLTYFTPKLSMIFCNTKSMVEELTENLQKQGFAADGIHGDMRQGQRLKVLNSFKSGRTSILVATDVAARGIDVDGIDYVFNYDIPQNNEYYIHRIGRTGRAGREGNSITLCNGRRQVVTLNNILRMIKSNATEEDLPSQSDIDSGNFLRISQTITDNISNSSDASKNIAESLLDLGLEPKDLISSLIEMSFKKSFTRIKEIKSDRREREPRPAGTKEARNYQKVTISIGRNNRIAPKHIVAAITEKTELRGGDIGKIEIYDDHTVVGIPSDYVNDTVSIMEGSKINGEKISITAGANDSENAPKRDFRRSDDNHRRRDDRRGDNRRRDDRRSDDRRSDNRRRDDKRGDKPPVSKNKKMSYKEYSKNHK